MYVFIEVWDEVKICCKYKYFEDYDEMDVFVLLCELIIIF